MSLIYVTGISGSGKSAVCKELVRRGYEAHEGDDGLSASYNIETGEMVKRPTNVAERTLEWRAQHSWKMSRDKLLKLKQDAGTKAVFVCGVASNEDEYLNVFDKVFALMLDKPTLKRRIQSRTNNNFGKSKHEMDTILEWHDRTDRYYREIGAEVIDATKPLTEVVDEIVSTIDLKLAMAMNDELIDIIDESGKVLRQAQKTEAHKQGWLHKTVIGSLRDGDDWILVCQAGHKQDAGQLVSPVGGHVKAGESEVDALLRESEEEIGTKDIKYKLVGRARFHRQIIGRDENHLFILFEITTDEKLNLGDESVSTERFTKADLMIELAEHPERFGDAYYFILEKFHSDHLPANWVKRWS